MTRTIVAAMLAVITATASVWAQAPGATPPAQAQTAAAQSAAAATVSTAPGVTLPQDYVIGINDTFDVFVWKDKDMSAENVVVRPDGKISLPLVNDIDAKGLTVEQLRTKITQEAGKYVTEPTVSVVVKQINSRRVSILGQVAKTGQYALLDRMTVVELITMAGGVAEYANKKKIRIARTENGKTVSILFNFKEYLDGKPRALEQNIELKPNDIVTVP